jgi:hypothetical protein
MLVVQGLQNAITAINTDIRNLNKSVGVGESALVLKEGRTMGPFPGSVQTYDVSDFSPTYGTLGVIPGVPVFDIWGAHGAVTAKDGSDVTVMMLSFPTKRPVLVTSSDTVKTARHAQVVGLTADDFSMVWPTTAPVPGNVMPFPIGSTVYHEGNISPAYGFICAYGWSFENSIDVMVLKPTENNWTIMTVNKPEMQALKPGDKIMINPADRVQIYGDPINSTTIVMDVNSASLAVMGIYLPIATQCTMIAPVGAFQDNYSWNDLVSWVS